MDFNFGEKGERGVSILMEEDRYRVYFPNYLYNQISMTKLSNWIRELDGEMDLKGNIFIPLRIKPSDIYYTYYHFIE